MELRINQFAPPAPVTFNYEELKAALIEKAERYEMVVYSDDQIKDAKKDRADLNRLKKALNDERIRLEKEYMTPFNDFKAKVNEIIGIIDRPAAAIDRQVKDYEQRQTDKKAEEIRQIFQELDPPEWLTVDRIWNLRWMNATYSMSVIRNDLQEAIIKVKAEMDAVKAIPEYAFEAAEVYKETLNLARALQEGRRLADIQRRKEEAERARQEAEAAAAQAAAQAATQPEPSPVEPAQEKVEAWNEPIYKVRFECFVTMTQARELRSFFVTRAIDYRQIKEGE